MKTFISSFTLCLIGVLFASSISAQYQNLKDDTFKQYDYHRQQKLGQTFNTGSSGGELESITIKISAEGNLQGGKLAIDLYELNGTTLKFIASSNDAGYYKGVTNTRVFAPNTNLAANKNYAFLIRSGNFFPVSGSENNPYLGGNAFVSDIKTIDPNNVNYKALPNFDLYFDIKLKNNTPKFTSQITCEGMELGVDSDKKIWEKRNGKWEHVGDRCNELMCNRRRVFCFSSSGGVWRYSGTPHNWTQANTLLAGQFLDAGKDKNGPAHSLWAANGKYFCYMQENGDIGIWHHNPAPKIAWSSKTYNAGPSCILIMQTDGNLVAYNPAKKAFWSSKTHVTQDSKYGEEKYKPVKAVLEDDGKLVLYSATGYRVWTSADGKLPLK